MTSSPVRPANDCHDRRPECHEKCSNLQTPEVPAWGIRADGTICFLNAAAESQLGMREAAVLNRPWKSLLELLDPQAAAQNGNGRVPTSAGLAGRTIGPLSHAKGGWFMIVAVKVPTPQDGLGCRVEAAIDISQWMRIETYLQGMVQGQVTPSVGPARDLTAREREVLHLLASGLSQHEIARKLFVSYVTVRTHVQRVLPKLGASSIQAAVARYLLDRENGQACGN